MSLEKENLISKLPLEVIQYIVKVGDLSSRDIGALSACDKSLREKMQTDYIAQIIISKHLAGLKINNFKHIPYIVKEYNVWKVLIHSSLLKTEEFCVLVSRNALRLYDEYKIDPSELYATGSKAKPLTSSEALECFKYTSFEFLSMQPLQKIEALTAKSALVSYENYAFTPEKLAQFEVPTINSKTSKTSRDINSKFFYIHDCDKDKSYRQIKEKYSTHPIIRLKLSGQVDEEKEKYLTNQNAKNCYIGKFCEMLDLVKLPIEKIEALTSENALKCYTDGFISFKDLAKFNVSEIEALTCKGMRKCYLEESISFKDLSELKSDDMLKTIISLSLDQGHECIDAVALPEEDFAYHKLTGESCLGE